MSQHLLIVHVGPVQDFIAAARRSRDLWFGSWLLSELSKAVAHRVAELAGGPQHLIFPAPKELSELAPDLSFTVANKVVALLPSVPDKLDHALRQAILDRLKALWEAVERWIASQGSAESATYDQQVAWQQIRDLPELYWVTVPVGEGPDGYGHARQEAEALMAARKSLRTFKAVSWAHREGTPKSSLDGSRESVIPERVYVQKGDDAATIKRKKQTLYNRFRARPSERLSGIDLLKRLGNFDGQERFPSTSHVAAGPLLEWMAQQDSTRQGKLRFAWMDYMGSVPGRAQERSGTNHVVIGPMDGSLLFESRLGEDLEEGELDETVLTKARDGLRRFLSAESGLGGVTPLPYYCLLVGDGDGMGVTIDRLATPEEHRAFSQKLADFAAEADELIREASGAPIYIGGDDIMALLPLHTALTCAHALAKRFQEQMVQFQSPTGDSPTLSAGLLVFHHLEPLADALRLARDAEGVAKAIEGKNALAVTVSKRSGVDLTVADKWEHLVPRLELFTRLHHEDRFPDGAAFELRQLALRFGSSGGGDDPTTVASLKRASVPEAMRILARKRAARGSEALSNGMLNWFCRLLGDYRIPNKETREEFLSSRWPIRDEQDASLPQVKPLVRADESPIEAVARLADELIIARLFADAKQQAEGKPATEAAA